MTAVIYILVKVFRRKIYRKEGRGGDVGSREGLQVYEGQYSTLLLTVNAHIQVAVSV